MKALIKNILLLLLVALLVTGIVWARGREGRLLCQRIDMQIVNADSTHFVTEKGLLTELEQQGIRVIGKPMNKIDATHIEQVLAKSEYLENVECIKARDGVIVIRASQLVPVLRVFDGNDLSYYINAAGKRMNATSTFYADVPLVYGHFTQQYPPTRLLPMTQYVENDSTLKSLVGSYTVRDSNNIFITPNIVGQVVNMGSVDGYASKFEKLKLFYSVVLPQKGWDTYDTISVKWNHQVVATKRKKAVREVMVYDPEEDEVAPDLETIAVDTATDKRQQTTTTAEPKPKAAEPKPKAAEPKPKPTQAKQTDNNAKQNPKTNEKPKAAQQGNKKPTKK